MRHFKTIPERGDFAYQCLVAPQKVSGRKLADLRDHYGLKFTKHMPFGCVRDADGHIYAMVRALNGPGSTPNPTKFVYMSTRRDGAHLRGRGTRLSPGRYRLTLTPLHGIARPLTFRIG